jgi:hypothetical protein
MSAPSWETPMHPTIRACNAVIDERARQEAQWGVQRHNFAVWMVVLGEEYGEACRALLLARACGPNERDLYPALRAELVQVAAVAVAAIEHLDEICP